jgi:hypothetical protein
VVVFFFTNQLNLAPKGLANGLYEHKDFDKPLGARIGERLMVLTRLTNL